VWGDQDSRGCYSIEQALGSTSVYRLWLVAQRCSSPTCSHAKAVSSSANAASWHRWLLGHLFPPSGWHGTAREWRQLGEAANRYCACP
jgi:hypothetical protein